MARDPFKIAGKQGIGDSLVCRNIVHDKLLEHHIALLADLVAFGDDRACDLFVGPLKGFSCLAEKVLHKKKDGRLWIESLVPIGQETLDHWGPLDELGFTTEFSQRDKAGKVRTAKMSKLLHFVWKGRKRNPQGKALFQLHLLRQLAYFRYVCE